MNLTTDYVSIAVRGERHLWSLAQSALPTAPVVPQRERDPLLDRMRRHVRSVARLLTARPSGSIRGGTAPAKG